MPNCFVIQPFDFGKFDKRFTDVYQPAIKAAGLDAYRVDRDPGVEVPIDAIEEGIKTASVCLADITTDNPNVWYELGFAFAVGRPVVMVCSKERPDKFPFDIQHRSIIPYRADSLSDFESLKTSITERIKAILSKAVTLRQIEEKEQVAEIQGLSQPELYVLAEISGSIAMPDDGVAVNLVRNEVERTLTGFGYSLGMRRLIKRNFIFISEDTNEYNGDKYDAVYLTDNAWDWIEGHEDLFTIHRPSKKPAPVQSAEINDDDDMVPF